MDLKHVEYLKSIYYNLGVDGMDKAGIEITNKGVAALLEYISMLELALSEYSVPNMN